MTPAIVAGAVGDAVDLIVLTSDGRRLCMELTLAQAERAHAELARAIVEARRGEES